MENKILKIVSDVCGEDAKLTDNFIDDLYFDSLDCVDLIIEIEEAFDIGIPDGDVEKIKTVQELINYVRSRGK